MNDEEYIREKLAKHKELKNSLKQTNYYFKIKLGNEKFKKYENLIKKIFEENRNVNYKMKLRSILMTKKFSISPKAYQIDIYYLGKRNPYLLAVNINTKYAWISDKLKSKSTTDVLPKIKQMVKELNPSIIESDDEAAFNDYRTINCFHENGIDYRPILQSLHSDLGVLNRCCKTLNSFEPDSENIKYIVKNYNKRLNESIKMAPREMENNRLAEEIYIHEMLNKRDEDNELMLTKMLKKGQKVRYIRDSPDLFEKGRHKYDLSKYYYKIEDVISPYTYVIIAKDGTVKTLPRYRIYKLKDSSNLSFAETIEDKSVMNIYKNPKCIFYEVYNQKQKWRELKLESWEFENKTVKMPKCWFIVEQIYYNDNGKKQKKDVKISLRDLREANPTNLSSIEKDILKNGLQENDYDKPKKYKTDETFGLPVLIPDACGIACDKTKNRYKIVRENDVDYFYSSRIVWYTNNSSIAKEFGLTV